MPLVKIHGIVVDSPRRAEALSAVGAAREHHVRSAAAERLHAGKHINIVVCGAAGTVNCQEALPGKSSRINSAAKSQAAAKVHLSDLIKCWCDARVLRVAGGIHQNGLLKLLAPPIKRFPLAATSSVPHTGEFGILSGVCQVTPPSVDRLNCPKLHGAAVLHTWSLEPVSRAVCLIDRKPLLVAAAAAAFGRQARP